MDSITERVKNYLKSVGITPKQAEEELSLGNGHLGKAYKSKNGLSASTLEKILKKYKIADILLCDFLDPKLQINTDSRIVQLEQMVKDKEKLISFLEREVQMYEDGGGIGLRERVKRTEESIKYLFDFFGDEKRYHRALDFIDQPLSKMAVSVANAKGEVEFVNLEFTNQTGFTIDEMFGKKAGDMLQKADASPKIKKEMSEAVKEKRWFEGEVVNYHKTGEKITCKLVIAPMLDKSENIEKLVSLAIFTK